VNDLTYAMASVPHNAARRLNNDAPDRCTDLRWHRGIRTDPRDPRVLTTTNLDWSILTSATNPRPEPSTEGEPPTSPSRTPRTRPVDLAAPDVRAALAKLREPDARLLELPASATPPGPAPSKEFARHTTHPVQERRLPSPAVPERFGPYRVVRPIAAGGMGQVFLARSASGAEVAVKRMHPYLCADVPDMRARFAREVAASRAVRSLFTVPVVAADVDAEVPWYATPFIDGPGLDSYVDERGPMAGPMALRLGVAMAEALVDIHSVDVVHRDLKPSNVLITEQGPRVIDFGISTLAGHGRLTHTGHVVGTMGYMAPECIKGGAPTTASDVFNLGLVVTFATTGRNPYIASTFEATMYRITTTDPDLDHLDPALRPVVGACLDRDPAARPAPADVVDMWGPLLSDGSGNWL
jgi:serine/threonine protein kinase